MDMTDAFNELLTIVWWMAKGAETRQSRPDPLVGRIGELQERVKVEGLQAPGQPTVTPPPTPVAAIRSEVAAREEALGPADRFVTGWMEKDGYRVLRTWFNYVSFLPPDQALEATVEFCRRYRTIDAQTLRRILKYQLKLD